MARRAHAHRSQDTYGGKSHIEQPLGHDFHQCLWPDPIHGAPENCVPRSWLLTFTDGSDEVTAQCYLHTSDYAQQGWCSKFDRVIKLLSLQDVWKRLALWGIMERPYFLRRCRSTLTLLSDWGRVAGPSAQNCRIGCALMDREDVLPSARPSATQKEASLNL